MRARSSASPSFSHCQKPLLMNTTLSPSSPQREVYHDISLVKMSTGYAIYVEAHTQWDMGAHTQWDMSRQICHACVQSCLCIVVLPVLNSYAGCVRAAWSYGRRGLCLWQEEGSAYGRRGALPLTPWHIEPTRRRMPRRAPSDRTATPATGRNGAPYLGGVGLGSLGEVQGGSCTPNPGWGAHLWDGSSSVGWDEGGLHPPLMGGMVPSVMACLRLTHDLYKVLRAEPASARQGVQRGHLWQLPFLAGAGAWVSQCTNIPWTWNSVPPVLIGGAMGVAPAPAWGQDDRRGQIAEYSVSGQFRGWFQSAMGGGQLTGMS